MKAILQKKSDILIVGGGIVGLSLALELHTRGAQVTILERDIAAIHASSAAAGMLAADDPHNPPALLPLARLSVTLYPAFLARIEFLSGLTVPFQTDTTLQHLADGSITRLAEHSLDPRQLVAALLAAVRATSIDLREHNELKCTEEQPGGVNAVTISGERFSASQLIYATGAWSHLHAPVVPAKGQMLRVRLPASLALREVHRSEQIYIVPRTHGPQAGTALIGATVEDVGFDLSTHASDLAGLRLRAAAFLPELASEADAPQVEAWAGLRPRTPDELPLLGRIGQSAEFLATGHFRNGILLAPATAVVLADVLENKSVDLSPFAPDRF